MAKSIIDTTNFDTTVKPTDDFFRYVNGGWTAKNPIPPDESVWGSFYVMREESQKALREIVEEVAAGEHPEGSHQQKIKDFYTTGMDEKRLNQDGIKPLAELLEGVANINGHSFSLISVIAEFHRCGIPALWSLGIDQDWRDNEVMRLYLGQGGLGLPDRDYYLKTDEVSKAIRDKYRAHIVALHLLAGDEQSSAEKTAETVMRIETSLAEASMTQVELRDPEKQYHKMTPEEIIDLAPKFQLRNYLELTKVLSVPDYIIVTQPLFFKRVNELLTSVPMEDWRTYLRWHLINSTASTLSDDFVNQSFEFYGKTLSGAKELKPRWKRCISALDDAMGEALGQEYVARHFPPKAKERIDELVDNLTAAYRARIEKLDWMESATKTAALEKLGAIKRKLGYPDTWRDYSELKINLDSYVMNCLRANKFEFNRQLSKLGKPVDRSEWFMYPQTVNAYFHPVLNEIAFPAAIMQPPFFDPDADDGLNYGGIGTVIGHELTHGFDDQGSKYDADGNLKNWWTETDRKHFDGKTAKVTAQFNDFRPLPDMSVNGELTLGENTADLGGLVIAYDALKLALEKSGQTSAIDGFTPWQRFFINYAQTECSHIREEELRRRLNIDPHSPSQYRVNGPLANMPEFYVAFDCQPGDALYRTESERAKVW